MNRFPYAARLTAGAAILVVSLCLASAVHAQTSNPRIGVVDIGRLIEQSPQFQTIRERLQEEFSSRERDINAQRRALQERVEVLERDAQVMGASERENLARQIREEQRNLQRAEEVFVEDADYRHNEEISRLQRMVAEEINIFAEREGFDVILVDVIYYSENVDITPQVLAALEERGSR